MPAFILKSRIGVLPETFSMCCALSEPLSKDVDTWHLGTNMQENYTDSHVGQPASSLLNNITAVVCHADNYITS